MYVHFYTGGARLRPASNLGPSVLVDLVAWASFSLEWSSPHFCQRVGSLWKVGNEENDLYEVSFFQCRSPP